MSGHRPPANPRRRALLAAGAALPWLGGCSREPAGREAIAGGWVGADVARGHALRDGGLRDGGRWGGGQSSGASAPGPGVASAGAPGSSPSRADPGSARRCAVAIVGGGVAGLAAARALRRAGVEDFRLFELEDAPGGNARGHVMGGMRCPLGAHYLPLPGSQAREVAEWLHEIGLARHEAGRTVYDERHLCHAPQERVFVPRAGLGAGPGAAPSSMSADGAAAGGRWQEGLLPLAEASPATLASLRRFSAAVRSLQAEGGFAIPTRRGRWNAAMAALDTQTFAAWLAAQGHGDPVLLGYLDYCCRDDYGAGIGLVSAWAGIHYFASRHGFRVPGEEGSGEANPDDAEPVLTWPEGNAFLTTRLAQGLGDRLQAGTVVTRVSPSRHEVAIEAWNARDGRPERWVAQRVLMCLPLFIAARLTDAPPAALQALAPRLVYAPWLVSNLQLREPLADRPGAPPAWDNVLLGSPALGYVDARHQGLDPRPGSTVLTHYWALGGQSLAELRSGRARLLNEPWGAWRDAVLADLARAHPDLPAKTLRADLMRYGHAMVVPTPGLRSDPALAALAASDPSSAPPAGSRSIGPASSASGRLHFAHADLSACSIFEEAFTHGTLAGRAAARALAGQA